MPYYLKSWERERPIVNLKNAEFILTREKGRGREKNEWQAWNWKSDPVSAAVPHIYCLIRPGQRFSGYLRKGRSVPEDKPAAGGANISAACEDGFRQGVKELSDEEKKTWLDPQTQTEVLSDWHRPTQTFQSTINCTMGVFTMLMLHIDCDFFTICFFQAAASPFTCHDEDEQLISSLLYCRRIWFTPF